MISSLQNPLVKYLTKLKHKSSFRKKEKKFVAEGITEIKRALEADFEPEKIIICPSILNDRQMLNHISPSKIIEVDKKVYEHLAYRGGTEGMMLLGRQKEFTELSDCQSPDGLILVAERIQKPGNIGALLRTTDAVGTDCVIFIDPQTDLYNPNVIRSSLGTVFTQRISITNLDRFIRFKQQARMKLFAATLQNSNIYWNENYLGTVAIAVGAEHEGLSEKMREIADKNIYIPMNGTADSLNVSVSAAVILYEALRQRSH